MSGFRALGSTLAKLSSEIGYNTLQLYMFRAKTHLKNIEMVELELFDCRFELSYIETLKRSSYTLYSLPVH